METYQHLRVEETMDKLKRKSQEERIKCSSRRAKTKTTGYGLN